MTFGRGPDHDTELAIKQALFMVLTVLGAVAFGLWQDSVMAGCFMFFALYLVSP